MTTATITAPTTYLTVDPSVSSESVADDAAGAVG